LYFASVARAVMPLGLLLYLIPFSRHFPFGDASH